MAFILFTIEGLQNDQCVTKIEKGMEAIQPSIEFYVQLNSPQLVVKYEDSEGSSLRSTLVDRIQKSINFLNYHPTYHPKSTLNVTKMRCQGCVDKITELAAAFDTFEADVQLEAPQVTLRYAPDATPQKVAAETGAFIELIEEAGFPTEISRLGRHQVALTSPYHAPDTQDQEESSRDIKSTQVHPAFVPPPEEERVPPHEQASTESTIRLHLEGMTCASCAATIEKALQNTPGIANATVNFATEEAVVQPLPEATLSDEELVSAVVNAGYSVSKVIREEDAALTKNDHHFAISEKKETTQVSLKRRQEAQQWLKRWIIGLFLAIPIMASQMVAQSTPLFLPHVVLVLQGIAGYLTAGLIITSGLPFFSNAWRHLKHFRATMDTLVALGAGVAFAFSLIQYVVTLFTSEPRILYFDSAAMIITLISVGKWLEARAKGDASQQLESLLQRTPKIAHRIIQTSGSETTQDVPLEAMKLGDLFLVKPGESVALDGVVVKGMGEIDASMVTGESMPISVGVGSQVAGGTINRNGLLHVRATSDVGNSTLAKIAQQIERAQATKAGIQRLADKVASYFVPAVLVVASITFLLWLVTGHSLGASILPAVAVLVVACPCALGLATPTAMMVGSAWGARHGIIINNVDALERARTIDTIVFDKTGTLTKGEFFVCNEEFFANGGELDKDELRRAIASIEHLSEHPLAAAIVNHFNKLYDNKVSLLSVDVFENHPGEGVSATLDGKHYRIGKPNWISYAHVNHSPTEGAETLLLVEVDGIVRAKITLIDEIKQESHEIIARIKAQGIEPWLITGDNAASAQRVAAEVGINEEHVLPGTLPSDKASKISELQAAGHRVAMVGDGVNDAPALAQAELGIAMGTGTDVAMETADITLLSGDLSLVTSAIAISRATFKKIRENLFWAFIYNIILIPIAAFGLLEPMYAALAMSLSSFFVVTNSLLLRRFDPTPKERESKEQILLSTTSPENQETKEEPK